MQLNRIILLPALLSLLLLGQGCSEDPEDPAVQIKQMLSAVEEAAEQRSISGVSDALFVKYGDKYHPNRQAVKRSLLGYFHKNQNIFLFSNIKSIAVDEDTQSTATAQVNVAMTGTQVDSSEELLLLKASVYQFNLELVKTDDQWFIKTSNWRRIKVTEF